MRFEPKPLAAAKDNGYADLISIEASILQGGYVATPHLAVVNDDAGAIANAMAEGTEAHRGALAGAILGRLAAKPLQTTLDEERAMNESLTELAEQLLPAEPVPV